MFDLVDFELLMDRCLPLRGEALDVKHGNVATRSDGGAQGLQFILRPTDALNDGDPAPEKLA